MVVILDGAAFYSLPEGSLDIAPDCRHSAGSIPALHILGRYVLLLQSHTHVFTEWFKSDALLNPNTSISIQKRHAYLGSLNSETSGQ